MIPYQFNIAFNMDTENGKYKFRMPTTPVYLQKHYQQKCLWHLTQLVLPDASTIADDNQILVRLNAPSSQTFIAGSVGGYANFQPETPAHVQFFTMPYDTGDRMEYANFQDEMMTAQIGASMWGNDLEISIYQVTNTGAFTLVDGTDEVIQMQIECVPYTDKYDFETFKK